MLKAENIFKSYKNQEVLRGISIEIKQGEFVSIMGESGSGKSTLLSILAGNLRADSGRALLNGEDLQALSESKLAYIRREKIGFVYQSLNLIPTLNAEDNILLPTVLAKKDKKSAKERFDYLARRLEISQLLKKMPDEMSGGQRQRVAIARGMINSPSVLMLDEPTGSLDSRTTGEVLELLRKINTEEGVTVIQVTHSSEAAAYSTRIIKISDGQVT